MGFTGEFGAGHDDLNEDHFPDADPRLLRYVARQSAACERQRREMEDVIGRTERLRRATLIMLFVVFSMHALDLALRFHML